MAACEIARNYTTMYAVFAIDDSSDIDILPTQRKSGTGDLKLSKPCSMGSIAKCSDGKQYRLNGTTNKWETYSGGSGGGGGPTPEEVQPIDNSSIESLFNF